MKNILLLILSAGFALQTSAQSNIIVMDSVIFYDGYAGTVSSPPPPAGVIRHRNDLYARKLTSAEIQSIGTILEMSVVIHALCDNYDRIGNVNMALVPIGASTYHPDSVQHLELARFITPFMNKNIQPDSVPYYFVINNVAALLKDTSITNNYDIWIELSVFGVPYAAQTQVSGCSGRNDTSIGKVELITDAPAPTQNTNVLIPLFFKNKFNNYQVGATDTIGKTTKSITFNVPVNLSDATFFLITSNHGANSGGEEYIRRFHYVYYDNNLMLTYKPGRTTCEPFRMYNTQPNGIYGSTPKTPAQWQSFSNWCPGDVIDIREINLGPVTAGNHTFMITVPTAVFTGAQGDFPLSLYFQGKTSGWVSVNENNRNIDNLFTVYPNPSNGLFTIGSSTLDAELLVTDILGKQIINTRITQFEESFHLNKNGVYFITFRTKQGVSTKKLIISQ